MSKKNTSEKENILPGGLINKASIIKRRELEPMLAKTRQILAHYQEAMGCSSLVLDTEGSCIMKSAFREQMRFCRTCRKCPGSHPCKETHYKAQMESRNRDETYIYTCAAGFIYWTSPLYWNGRYAGALTAGQVILPGRKKITGQFLHPRKEGGDSGIGGNILADLPEKGQEEIQAMASLLGICAKEASETGDEPGDLFHRAAWQNTDQRLSIRQDKAHDKEKLPSGGDSGKNAPEKPEYSFEKERLILAAFKRGDIDTGDSIINDLMHGTLEANGGNLEFVRLRAIDLVVLLSRAAALPDSTGNDVHLEANNRYLRRIQESKTPEELVKNLQLAAKYMSGKIFSFKGKRHASVLRKAERYIWDNYARKISLDEISRASGLSAPYFSSIFKEEMGENLSSYLNRLRIGKAAALLMENGKTLNQIARLCGFDDQSWFSKTFKHYMGMSPGKYRDRGNRPPEYGPIATKTESINEKRK